MDYLDLAKQLQVANKAKKANKASQTLQTPSEGLRNKSAEAVTETAVRPGVALLTKSAETPDSAAAELQPTPSGVALPAKPDAVPRLPWQLEALLRAACAAVLPESVMLPSGLITDLNRYVLGWGCSYLVGDRDEAERRLWQVYRAWKGVN